MTTPASTVPPENILLTAKHTHNLTFAQLSQLLHPRNEVSVASLFLSSHPPPTPQEIQILSEALKIPENILHSHFNPTTSFLGGYATASYPDRGRSAIEMPPREPLIYRLYEIVMNYGAAYKAVLNELFGDGIMSAIAFSTKVEKEVERDEKTGVETQWAVITLRGKWLPYSRF